MRRLFLSLQSEAEEPASPAGLLCPDTWKDLPGSVGHRERNTGTKEGWELEGSPSHSWVTVAEIAIPLKAAQGLGLRLEKGDRCISPPVVQAESKSENESGGLKL